MAVAMAEQPSSAASFDVENESQLEKNEHKWGLKGFFSVSGDFLKFKGRRNKEDSASCADAPKQATPPQTPTKPGLGRRLSRRGLVGIPRSQTFRRQEEEQRKNLQPVEPSIEERRDHSKVRQRALSAVPVPVPSRPNQRGSSVPPDFQHVYHSIDERIDQNTSIDLNAAQMEQEQIPPPPPPLPHPPPEYPESQQDGDPTYSEASYDDEDALDEELMEELKKKWILNLSMHFRDKSPREKFFLTYAETTDRWRRVTVSCDYRNVPKDSFEQDLQNLQYQKDKSAWRDTRPISHDQLVIEVKGIYAGLVMIEAKCIEIDEKQSAAAQEKDPSKRATLKNDQYQPLIALHKQLLHEHDDFVLASEHHDFFLASQHPAASPALSGFAGKYSMPARMWRHGIHAFLEVLRHRLPESLEHMLAFIYIAHSMVAQLHETVPTFEDTWIDCLSDLSRYLMAIEDDDPKDHEVWSNVARFWYKKAADKSPPVGRLHHHLAILARPYSLEQLSLYTRALACVTPFESARGSVMTLFTPITSGRYTTEHQPSSLEVLFIKAPRNLFNGDSAVTGWNVDLEDYSLTKTSKFEENGIYAAILTFAAATFEYASLRGRMLWFDGLVPLIITGTQFGSTTKHQLITTTIDVLRSALDQISHWKRRFTSNDKASGSIRWPPICAACKLRSSLALTLITCSNFVEPTAARTISRNTGNEVSTDRIAVVVLPLAHWPCLVFVIIALLVAQYLAHMKDAIFVWGTMMTIWAFGWWTIRADSGTTLQISGM